MSKRIALVGLDGSGKSANISIMKEDEAFADYSFMWVRWEPKLLKPVYLLVENSLRNKRDNGTSKVVSSGESSMAAEHTDKSLDYNRKKRLKSKVFKSPIVRSVWMFLATSDYFFQFYAKAIWLLIKCKDLIFDRFFLDLYVDQGINFGYQPEVIERNINRHKWLFPPIYRYIYIRVSPDTCYKRKSDIPEMDYLYKRFAIYEKLSTNTDWVVIDGEQPLEIVYAQIKESIFELQKKESNDG